MIDYLKSKAQSQGIPWQTLLKEALQVLFLEAFYGLPSAPQAVFQGGTALRLAYGGPRHSEDLDFVTESPLESWEGLRSGIFEKLKAQEDLLQGTLELTTQKSYSKILRWKLKWTPRTGREKVFVRAEWAAYPHYTRELKPLSRPAPLPAGAWLVIPVESREEILADKLAAIAGRPYLKGRDFFDLWLLSSQGIAVDADLVKKKLKDYDTRADGLLQRRSEINAEILQRDLRSFLPLEVRRPLEADAYRGILELSRSLLARTHKML